MVCLQLNSASPSDIDPLSPALAGRQLEEEVKEEWEEGSEEEWEEDEDEDEEPEPEPKRKGKQKGKGPAYPHNIFS